MDFTINRETYDKHNPEKLVYKATEGITEELVREISKQKDEPEWMLNIRLKGLELFHKLPLPTWGPDLSKLDLSQIIYFLRPDAKKNATTWDDVPDDIRQTYEKLGIPQAERAALAGVGAQYESEVVYHKLQKELEDQGVVFLDCDEAVKQYPELVKQYFMTTCVPIGLHKFSALHAAVWSGGTFIYVPKGVKVEKPLQAYFRMNARKGGQFEHTLIIVDEDAQVSYLEGCFVAGQLIQTKEGLIPIEQIKPQNLVLTSEGEYKPAKDIQKQKYSGTITHITYRGDTTARISATQEHPILYVDKKHARECNTVFKPRWNIPAYAKKGDYVCVPIIQSTEHSSERTFVYERKIDGKKEVVRWPISMSKEFFRLIGYYLAEGSVRDQGYLHFSFHSKETEYMDDVEFCLRKVFGIKKTIRQVDTKKNGTSIVVCSVDLARIFCHFGTSSSTKQVPQWVLTEKKSLQKELVMAWFRGDGNYFKRKLKSGLKESFRINTTSKTLARQGRDMLLRIGIVPSLNHQDRTKKNRQTIYTLSINGKFIPLFGEMVGITCATKINGKSRASLYGINSKFAFYPIASVTHEVVKQKTVYNFGVEEHQTYTAGGIAVHNCSAPVYTENSLHAGCVEIHVLKNARARYSSIENWSKNTYNLNTKRAVCQENAIIEWINGNMGCLTKDAKVFTNPSGPRSINAIAPGDKVLSFDQTSKKIVPSKVGHVKYNGEKEVFTVSVAGRTVTATENHPFLTLSYTKNQPHHKKGFFAYEWKPLSQLQKGDLISITKEMPIKGQEFTIPDIKNGEKITSKNQYSSFQMNTKHLYNTNIIIPKKTTDDFMWLMGILIGDGHIDIKQNKINIATHVSEDFRYSKVITLLKKLFNYTVTEFKERYIIINSKKLCELFTVLGISGTANTKRVPNWVYTLPESQMQSFLAGYFDSDGHVGKHGAYFTSINKELLQDIQLLSIQLGYGVSNIFHHMPKRKTIILGKECDAKGSYRLLLNGERVKSLPSRCKKKAIKISQCLTRRCFNSVSGKNLRSKTTHEIGFAKIDSITPNGIQPTFDIEVEKYHNFIANGVVVHNSGVTMLYPASVLKGDNSKSDFIGIALANADQNQDTGCKITHIGKNTSSTITSKSISLNGGISTYRGLVQVRKGATNAAVNVECDALIMDNKSQSNTYPYIDIREEKVDIAHEATVGKISEEQIFYLMSRGLDEETATQMIVSGFIEPVVKELPLEYAAELNQLIKLEMEGSLG